MSKNTRARNIILVAIVILAVVSAVAACFAVEKVGNEAEFDVCGDFINYNGINAAPLSGSLKNAIIFICFSDDSASSVAEQAERKVSMFNGPQNSLEDYYDEVSFGKIQIDTYFPLVSSSYYVYRCSSARSVYAAVTDKTGKNRYNAESVFLNAAVNAAAAYFDSSVDLDGDGDGYVDSVTFIISGQYNSSDENAWGGLLWPHAWDLETISNLAGTDSAYLNGAKVKRYALQFIDNLNTGLLCHETGHVLGFPDLYHYDADTEYVQVGHWDIMHMQNDVPQYPTTYLRDKYLKVLPENSVGEIKNSGVYSLGPTSIAEEGDVLAYRIIVTGSEEIWMEYRNNGVSLYDSGLPGSGLVVYRVNREAEGNEEGRHQSSKNPDEVYFYRPAAYSSGFTRDRETRNLDLAYLSPTNRYFNSLGGKNYSTKYYSGAIFLTNGDNTDIKITPISMTDETINFSVELSELNSEVTEMYVENSPVRVAYGEEPVVSVKIKTRGSDIFVDAPQERIEITYDPTRRGSQQASVRYTGTDGITVVRTFTIIIEDPAVDAEIILPEKTEYNVGDNPDFTGLGMRITFRSGERETVYYTEPSDWRIEGYDLSSAGYYRVMARYLRYDVVGYFFITVNGDLQYIRIAEKNTEKMTQLNGVPKLTVVGYYNDGKERILNADEYVLSGFSTAANQLYLKQEATITATENRSLTDRSYFYAVDFSALISLEITSAPKRSYRYGEELDLSGGLVTAEFHNGVRISVSAENYYDAIAATFDPEKSGAQEGRLALGDCEVFFSFNVGFPDGSVVASGSQGVTVDFEKRYVLFSPNTKLADAENYLSSYLDIVFTVNDGEYELSGTLFPETLVNSSMRILVKNSAGTLFSLRVYVKGDVNGDGLADVSDRTGWADMLFNRNEAAKIYLDMNGDGIYNLTDFVQLNGFYGGVNG